MCRSCGVVTAATPPPAILAFESSLLCSSNSTARKEQQHDQTGRNNHNCGRGSSSNGGGGGLPPGGAECPNSQGKRDLGVGVARSGSGVTKQTQYPTGAEIDNAYISALSAGQGALSLDDIVTLLSAVVVQHDRPTSQEVPPVMLLQPQHQHHQQHQQQVQQTLPAESDRPTLTFQNNPDADLIGSAAGSGSRHAAVLLPPGVPTMTMDHLLSADVPQDLRLTNSQRNHCTQWSPATLDTDIQREASSSNSNSMSSSRSSQRSGSNQSCSRAMGAEWERFLSVALARATATASPESTATSPAAATAAAARLTSQDVVDTTNATVVVGRSARATDGGSTGARCLIVGSAVGSDACKIPGVEIDFPTVAANHPLRKSGAVRKRAPLRLAVLNKRALPAVLTTVRVVDALKDEEEAARRPHGNSAAPGNSSTRLSRLADVEEINAMSRDEILKAIRLNGVFSCIRELQCLVHAFLAACEHQLTTAQLRQLHYVLSAVPKHHLSGWLSGLADLPLRRLAPLTCFEENPKHSATAAEVSARETLARISSWTTTTTTSNGNSGLPRRSSNNGGGDVEAEGGSLNSFGPNINTEEQATRCESATATAAAAVSSNSAVAAAVGGGGNTTNVYNGVGSNTASCWWGNFVAGDLLLSFMNFAHPRLRGPFTVKEAQQMSKALNDARGIRNPKKRICKRVTTSCCQRRSASR